MTLRWQPIAAPSYDQGAAWIVPDEMVADFLKVFPHKRIIGASEAKARGLLPTPLSDTP